MGYYRKPYVLLKRKLKSGKIIYYYRLPDDPKRVQHSTGKTTKYEARQYVEALLEERKNARYKITLLEYAGDFFDWEKCGWIRRQLAKGRSFSKQQAQKRRSHLFNYLFPAFGNMILSDITPVMIEDFLIGLELANQTKNHILYSLNIVLNEAVREDLLKVNPVDKVEPLAKNYKKRDALSLEDIKLLFPLDVECLLEIWDSPLWYTLFYTMLTTGLRSGEARALIWQDVLWDLGALVVMRAAKWNNEIGLTKSRETRGVFLPERTLKMLENWRGQNPFKEGNQLIFGSDGYNSFHKETVLDHFKKAMKRAGVNTDGKNLVVHSLRHTYNTRMRMVLPEVMLHHMIGHKSMAMTEQYDHATPEERLREFLPERGKVEVWE